MNRSDSELYKEGSITRTSNINKLNAQLADEYKQKMANEEKDSLYGQAQEQGFQEGKNSAYMDVMERLNSAASPFTPIIEGSPEDVQMQADVDRGLSYQPSQEPGLLQEVEQLNQSAYAPEAEASAEDLMEDAHTSAFMAAEAMGDTSEENMNKLVTQELTKRGL